MYIYIYRSRFEFLCPRDLDLLKLARSFPIICLQIEMLNGTFFLRKMLIIHRYRYIKNKA